MLGHQILRMKLRMTGWRLHLVMLNGVKHLVLGQRGIETKRRLPLEHRAFNVIAVHQSLRLMSQNDEMELDLRTQT